MTTHTFATLQLLDDANAARVRGSHSIASFEAQRAAALLTLGQPPAIGAGGEAVPPATKPGQSAAILRETLDKDTDATGQDASNARAQLLLQAGTPVAAMALDAVAPMSAGSSLERMLGHQLAACHDAAMRYLARALEQRETVEGARLANVTARFMTVYQEGLLTCIGCAPAARRP